MFVKQKGDIVLKIGKSKRAVYFYTPRCKKLKLRLSTRPPWLHHANTFYFHNILKFQSLYHDLLNQYQACWYLFECIFYSDST